MGRLAHLTVALAILAALAPSPSALAQDEAPPSSGEVSAEAGPLLTLESVEVRGPDGRPLGRESLARLTVKLSNRGESIASSLVFDVSVAGHELPVYRSQVFLKAVPAGETVELPLYNFWTGETGRPAPADGELEVVVTLREARWVELTEEDGVEVWTPLGEVEGLPSSASTTVELDSGS